MKQVAKFAWALPFVLAACGQSPTPGTPEPSDNATSHVTMSTEADDAAKRIFVDTEGGSYVLGSAGPSVFLNHYRMDGSLVWRTDTGLTTCEACYTLDVRLVGDTPHILTLEGESLTLSTFTADGQKVSSQALEASGTHVSAGSLDASGRPYLLSLTQEDGGTTWYLDVLNARGEKEWSQSSAFATVRTSYSESGVSLALAPDDSVYLAGIGALQKYDKAGALLWSREFPFNDQTHLREHVTVGSDGSVYHFRDLTSGDVVAFNSEIRRFDSAGQELWVRTLLSDELVDRNRQILPVQFASSPSGAIFLISEESYSREDYPYVAFDALYKIMPGGTISFGVNMGVSRVYDLAFAPFEEEQPDYIGMDAKVGYLFMVGSSVRAEGMCYDPEDESTGSPYCPDTDAFITEYHHFSTNQEVTAKSDVVWTRY